jgi:hypothetical protein
MKILSIDVGIKNLAFCLFDKSADLTQFKVTKWDIINISEQEDNLLCGFVEKNITCNKPAKFKKNEQCFCLKHSKKQPNLQIPTSQQKPAFINKQKIQKLFEIATSHGIKYQPKIKKNDLVQLINEYVHQNYFENIESKKADKIDLFNIGLNIKTKFNKLFETEGKIDYVIIENQISPIATRMKTIQGMIVQYFIMSNIQVDHIDFISAANKLKDFGTNTNNSENKSKDNVDLDKTEKSEKSEKPEKTKYSDRKKMGISKCLEIITNDFRFNEHVNYFSKHKKKDDLSDSFLQGLWFIHHHKL